MPPPHGGVKANSRCLTDDTLEVGGAFRDNFAMCGVIQCQFAVAGVRVNLADVDEVGACATAARN